MTGFRVAVVGGGLGGLCLAKGLLRALPGGADVTVYERDASLAGRRQGYRLHLDVRAGLALQQCLPPESFAMFPATCGQASTRLTVVNERLRVLHQSSTGDPAADPYAPVVAAVGDYEGQMRGYGYAAVAASRQAEGETGARHNKLMFWLYRRLARDPA